MKRSKSESEGLYKVQEIVDRRKRNNRIEYRVRWKGYPPDQDSWEPYSNLKQACPILISDFLERRSQNSEKTSDCERSISSLNSSPSIKKSGKSIPSSPISLQSISPTVPKKKNSNQSDSDKSHKKPPSKNDSMKNSVPNEVIPNKVTQKKSNISTNKVWKKSQSTSDLKPRKSVTVKIKTSPTLDIKNNITHRSNCNSFPQSSANNKRDNQTPDLKDFTKSVNESSNETADEKSISGSQKSRSKALSKERLHSPKNELSVKVDNSSNKSESSNNATIALNSSTSSKSTVANKNESNIKKESSNSSKHQSISKVSPPASSKQPPTAETTTSKQESSNNVDPAPAQSKAKRSNSSKTNCDMGQSEADQKDKENKQLVIKAIHYLKSQKRRPDSENMYRFMKKYHEMSEPTTKAILNKCVQMGILEEVKYKKGISYRTLNSTSLSAKISHKYHKFSDKKLTNKKPSDTSKSIKTSSGVQKRKSDIKIPDQPSTKTIKLSKSNTTNISNAASQSNGSNSQNPKRADTIEEKNKRIMNNLPKNAKLNCQVEQSDNLLFVVPPCSPTKWGTFDNQINKLPYHRHPDVGPSANPPDPTNTGDGSSSITGSSESTNSDIDLCGGLRRSSARQTESVYRYKDIIVKKNVAGMFTEVYIQSQAFSLKNPFTINVLRELVCVLNQTKEDTSRLVVLSGMGPIFSSGLDLMSLHTKDLVTQMTKALRLFLLALSNFPKPVVAAVNGPAVGLGVAILPLCDLIYATDKATFYLPYAKLGQIPEGGASYTLTNLIGQSVANDLLLGGRKMTSREALQCGLISDILYPKNFKQEILKRCQKLATSSAKALQLNKCILRFQHRDRIDMSIKLECAQLEEIWDTLDFRRLLEEFVNKQIDMFL